MRYVYHMASLERCATCGGRKYLVARPRRRGITLQVIDQCGRRRQTKSVAFFPWSVLDYHSPRNVDPGGGDGLDKFVLELRTRLTECVSTIDKRTERATRMWSR